MDLWATKVNLFTNNISIKTNTINYITGLLQGDCLSLLLFILSLNPLSFLLSLLPGYNIAKTNNNKQKLTHLFFVDDLKTFSKNKKEATLQLDLITQFTKDIDMKFGQDKYAYIYIVRGIQKSLGTKLSINGTDIEELDSGETYTYLGQDEDIGFKGELNKQKVTKKYLRRVKQTWNSELYSRNKVLAHNIFTIPVLTPTFGILEWTKQDLDDLDIKTRKILTACASFHINSDIDRLYRYRKYGGRGLNSISDTYVTRIVSLALHLKYALLENRSLQHVVRHESEGSIRVAENPMENFDIDANSLDHNAKTTNLSLKRKIKSNHLDKWVNENQHRYLKRSRKSVQDIDNQNTEIWLKNAPFSSHTEGFIFAFQEEETYTNHLAAKRDKGNNKSAKCRLCKTENETTHHIIVCCLKLSASMYLPVRHNKVAKVIYDAIIDHDRTPIEEIYTDNDKEIWWDKKVTTIPLLKHNKPDIVYWSKTENKCCIIDIAIGLDIDVGKNINLKYDNYMQLSSELKRLYPSFTFEIISIVLGATGLVPSSLQKNIEKVDVKNIQDTMLKCQRMALLGTVKRVKTVLKMKNI